MQQEIHSVFKIPQKSLILQHCERSELRFLLKIYLNFGAFFYLFFSNIVSKKKCFCVSDLSLQDFLLHEYNVCNVRSVRIGHSGRHGRYAVIYLATMTDVAKALDETRLITKSYPNAEAEVLLAGEEVVEDKRLFYRPSDAEVEEFHPKATRTLYVGGLSRETASNLVQEKFERFGEILEIDIKKSGLLDKKQCFANVQFTDLISVCRAIKECDQESVQALVSSTASSAKLTLGFAKAQPTKCVWCCGVAECVKEKDIAHEFGRYGKIQDILILRSRGQALVWFDQVSKQLYLSKHY